MMTIEIEKLSIIMKLLRLLYLSYNELKNIKYFEFISIRNKLVSHTKYSYKNFNKILFILLE